MARKSVTEVPVLKSWEDVDKTLREIAEEMLALGDIESDMQRQIIGIKKISELKSKPHAEHIKSLERDLKEFVGAHRDELGKSKTRVLNFGSVGYRISTSVVVPKAKDKLNEVIKKLRARKMSDCIKTEEKILKDNLKKYGEDAVTAVGCVWKQEDAFGYDVALDKLERQIAANI